VFYKTHTLTLTRPRAYAHTHAHTGALAARVREGKRVSLVAIGVDAVSNAVLTIGNARLYLEENTLVRASVCTV
jgi:stage V sporulation protein SpoVS